MVRRISTVPAERVVVSPLETCFIYKLHDPSVERIRFRQASPNF
jgi:hypothetical protein